MRGVHAVKTMRTRRIMCLIETALFKDHGPKPSENCAFGTFAQRLALPASGRDERTPFYRNPLEATETPEKRAESHLSGARCVGQFLFRDGIYFHDDTVNNLCVFARPAISSNLNLCLIVTMQICLICLR